MPQAIWHTSKTQTIVKEEPLSDLSEGFCSVKSLFSLISSGTERLVATGKVPAELYTKMEVPYMQGRFPFPVKYGYSLVGEVASPDHPWYGRLVHLMHPHQGHVLAKATDMTLLPDDLPARRATLASNLETAVNAVWDAKVSVGDRVLVVGFGMIGALVSRLLSWIPAVELLVAEQNPKRRELARRMGFDPLSTPQAGYFDQAFHTSSSAAGLQTCIDAVGMEGTVVELSWFGNQAVQLQLGGGFHYQRKKIISSQVSHIPGDRQQRWDYRRRKEVVLQLLQNAAFDEHITDEIALQDAPTFFDQLRNGTADGLGYCINYNSEKIPKK